MADKSKAKRPKYGGRVAGTPNKSTVIGKEAIVSLLSKYKESGMMESDFLSLAPDARIHMAEKLMPYIMPKMQSVAMDVNGLNTQITIENKLRALAESNEH